MRRLLPFLALLPALLLACCTAGGTPHTPTSSGHLVLIGGALRDDNDPVFSRLLALAHAHEPASVVIVTAASSSQDQAAASIRADFLSREPGLAIATITRETTADEGLHTIDGASLLYFTGGDQKRITDRYRPGPDSPEYLAMRRLLARGGTIAGSSAGDAMMSDPMFLTGDSAHALGFGPADADHPTGPQIGRGMGFLPRAIADSHFLERDRFGRLVAALEISPPRLGLGVAENAAIEVDLATGECVGLTEAPTLLVDARAASREGLSRSAILASLITRGRRFSLRSLNVPQATSTPPPGPQREVLASLPAPRRRGGTGMLFAQAASSPGVWSLTLGEYRVRAWSIGEGWLGADITPAPLPLFAPAPHTTMETR